MLNWAISKVKTDAKLLDAVYKRQRATQFCIRRNDGSIVSRLSASVAEWEPDRDADKRRYGV